MLKWDRVEPLGTFAYHGSLGSVQKAATFMRFARNMTARSLMSPLLLSDQLSRCGYELRSRRLVAQDAARSRR